MARTYAGILGLLAFATSLARVIFAGGGTDAALWTACCGLVAFSVAGAVFGWIAEQTVEESVHGRVAAELAGQKAAEGSRSEKGPSSADR